MAEPTWLELIDSREIASDLAVIAAAIGPLATKIAQETDLRRRVHGLAEVGVIAAALDDLYENFGTNEPEPAAPLAELVDYGHDSRNTLHLLISDSEQTSPSPLAEPEAEEVVTPITSDRASLPGIDTPLAPRLGEVRRRKIINALREAGEAGISTRELMDVLGEPQSSAATKRQAVFGIIKSLRQGSDGIVVRGEGLPRSHAFRHVLSVAQEPTIPPSEAGLNVQQTTEPITEIPMVTIDDAENASRNESTIQEDTDTGRITLPERTADDGLFTEVEEVSDDSADDGIVAVSEQSVPASTDKPEDFLLSHIIDNLGTEFSASDLVAVLESAYGIVSSDEAERIIITMKRNLMYHPIYAGYVQYKRGRKSVMWLEEPVENQPVQDVTSWGLAVGQNGHSVNGHPLRLSSLGDRCLNLLIGNPNGISRRRLQAALQQQEYDAESGRTVTSYHVGQALGEVRVQIGNHQKEPRVHEQAVPVGKEQIQLVKLEGLIATGN